MMRAHSREGPSEVPDQLIGRRQLRHLIPTSDMTVWRWERAGIFPKHITINGRNYWRRSEINAWLSSHVTDADLID